MAVGEGETVSGGRLVTRELAEWVASRSEKAQKKEERQAEKAAAPVDEQAQARREAQRWQRIENAAEELQRWLGDQMRQGLGNTNSETLNALHRACQSSSTLTSSAPRRWLMWMAVRASLSSWPPR